MFIQWLCVRYNCRVKAPGGTTLWGIFSGKAIYAARATYHIPGISSTMEWPTPSPFPSALFLLQPKLLFFPWGIYEQTLFEVARQRLPALNKLCTPPSAIFLHSQAAAGPRCRGGRGPRRGGSGRGCASRAMNVAQKMRVGAVSARRRPRRHELCAGLLFGRRKSGPAV